MPNYRCNAGQVTNQRGVCPQDLITDTVRNFAAYRKVRKMLQDEDTSASESWPLPLFLVLLSEHHSTPSVAPALSAKLHRTACAGHRSCCYAMAHIIICYDSMATCLHGSLSKFQAKLFRTSDSNQCALNSKMLSSNVAGCSKWGRGGAAVSWPERRGECCSHCCSIADTTWLCLYTSQHERTQVDCVCCKEHLQPGARLCCVPPCAEVVSHVFWCRERP